MWGPETRLSLPYFLKNSFCVCSLPSWGSGTIWCSGSRCSRTPCPWLLFPLFSPLLLLLPPSPFERSSTFSSVSSGSLNKRKPTLTSSSSCYRHSKIPPGKRNIKSRVPSWNGNKSKTHISITEKSSFAPKRAFHEIARIVGHKEQCPEMLLQEKNVRVCPEIATRKFCNVLWIFVSTKEAGGRGNRQRLGILLLPANNPILSFFKREFMYNLLLFLLFLLPLSCTDLPEELQGYQGLLSV